VSPRPLSSGTRPTRAIQQLVGEYRERLLAHANRLVALPPARRRSYIDGLVNEMIEHDGHLISERDRDALISIILDEMVGLGPLEPLMLDPEVTEVLVNWTRDSVDDAGQARVFVERHGHLELVSDIWFEGYEHVLHILHRIVAPLGRRIDETVPMVDARLPDGSRINAVIRPLAVDGPLLSIRRFRRTPLTISNLIASETLTDEMAEFLIACVVARRNILVSGGTGSGKTTLLNVLGSFIPEGERIVTIEDSAELQIHRDHPHVARMESRPPNVEGTGEITIRQLVRNALRMRPDRIIVGEVRGAETLDMLQAMNTGHDGSMTTVHANSPDDAFKRLETMMMWAEGAKELPLSAIREQLASAIHLVVHQARLPAQADGQRSRKVVRISEVQGVRHNEIVLRDLFVYHQGATEQGQQTGEFTATGALPRSLPQIEPRPGALEHLFQSHYLSHALGTNVLQNQQITEIMINGPHDVWLEEQGKGLRREPSICFRDRTHLLNVINTIIAPLDRHLDEQTPMVDARLPDDARFPGGGRINAVLNPVALQGPVLTIRRFSHTPFSLQDLVARGALTPLMADFLRGCVIARRNILISGGTGSGKTTLLGAIASEIDLMRERICTIEDAAELRIGSAGAHVVGLEARPPDRFGEGEITIRQLVRNALRMRPDRIIVGEVRGAEALDMLQAMNTGHDGSLTTVHANSPQEAFNRLETMVLWAPEAEALSLAAIRRQLCTIDIVIQQSRLADHTRKVTRIAEVLSPEAGGASDGPITVRDIFRFNQHGIEHHNGRDVVLGEHGTTGYRPVALDVMHSYGITLEDAL
jgi:pilus assembly protein CpaF